MSDLIERQAAIDDICEDWCGYKNSQCPHPFKPEEDDYYWCDGCGSVERIKNLPSATPDADTVARDIATIIENEQDMRVILQNADRTATWVPEPDRRNHWHCSNCGYVIGILKVDAKYCLNCGCQMREGDNA